MSFKKGEIIPALQIHLEYLSETLGDDAEVRQVDLVELAERYYPQLLPQLHPYAAALVEMVFRECHKEQADELIAEGAFWGERFLPAAMDLVFIGACVGYASDTIPRKVTIAEQPGLSDQIAAHFYAKEAAIMDAAFQIARTDQLGFEHAYRRVQRCYEPLKASQAFTLTISLRMVAFGLLVLSGRALRSEE
ncbi:MAG: hypothetical protein KDB07_13740 [Planctomycetes bacterium]|nr:hypothetical protein [Planctomycetota bacterium]